jgi:hypothetical protein
MYCSAIRVFPFCKSVDSITQIPGGRNGFAAFFTLRRVFGRGRARKRHGQGGIRPAGAALFTSTKAKNEMKKTRAFKR